MSNSRHLLLLLLAFSCFHSSSNSSPSSFSPSVLEEDGDDLCNGTVIPFPFGISGHSTYPLIPGFNITCKQGNTNLLNSPPRLSVTNSFFSELPLLEISVTDGFVRVKLSPFYWRCDRGFDEEPNLPPVADLLKDSPFTFSATRNVLTVIGCDAMVFLRPQGNKSNVRSCVSFCEGTESVVDGSCSGVGCCQASLPEKLKSFNLDFESIRNMTGSRFNTTACGKAFIVEQKAFEFSVEDLNSVEGDAPVVLDWSIGNKSCEEAKRSDGDSYLCAEKAECHNSSTGIGYLCRCMDGYDGNPYLRDGCKDIDECSINGTSPCLWKCKNLDGDYHCACPLGKIGDGKKQGNGCKKVASSEIALAAGLCFLLLLFSVTSLSYTKMKKRRVEKLKQKYFMQNGGLLLQRHFSVREAAAKIFTAGELERATDKFSESHILGHGGYGTVYKGILSDGREVAIKKSKLMDDTQIEQFINEVVILSQINHRNVVKLLGCCMETQVPLLVYEFISNGTLLDRIHSYIKLKTSPLSWEIRLRIAGETAAALAYLHKAASTPIIHRDVKSANILLDEEFTAKVSDFGASRLVPYNQTHVTTVVQGTLGYLDPEYFHTGLLSEKSDVYSFGVVLVELLTAENPVSFCKSEEERNLASHFVRLVKENRILEMVDRKIAEECSMSLSAAAELASRCLKVSGEDRPMMLEVAVELNALSRLLMLRRSPERLGGEEQSKPLIRPLNICRNDGENSMEDKLL